MTADPKPVKADVCKRGHSLADAWVTSDGRRNCRTCGNERNRRYRERNARPEQYRQHERAKYQAAKGGAKTVACVDCGAGVVVYSTLTRRRCPDCRYRRYHEPRTCPVCGREFVPGHGERKTCSLACRAAKFSRERDGDGNPAYRTGRRVGENIPGWRLQAKGERRCRNCGGRERLQLHHAIPRGKWRAGRADLRNGVPLCGTCHDGWHHHKLVIYRDIFTLEEWTFISAARLTGQSTEAWLDDRYPARPCLLG